VYMTYFIGTYIYTLYAGGLKSGKTGGPPGNKAVKPWKFT